MGGKKLFAKKKKKTRQLTNLSQQEFIRCSPTTQMKHSGQNVSAMASAFCRKREL